MVLVDCSVGRRVTYGRQLAVARGPFEEVSKQRGRRVSGTDHERAAGEATGVRSVRRALDILGLLTEDQPTVTLREIVDATGLAKTTVVRMVQTLEQCGLLWDTPAGYTAGPGLWRWAHLAQTSWELPRETRKLMRDLAEEQQETVNLFMLRGLSRVCVAQQESPQPLRHVVRVGDELPCGRGPRRRSFFVRLPTPCCAGSRRVHRTVRGMPGSCGCGRTWRRSGVSRSAGASATKD